MHRHGPPDPNQIALGVRQPWAELIVRGLKSIEVRSQNTTVRGRVYIYASKKMSELADAHDAARQAQLDNAQLPRGVVVGSVEIYASLPAVAADAAAACVSPELLENQYGWRLRDPIVFDNPLAVKHLPYGVWFYPWKRRTNKGKPSARRKK